VAITQIPSVLQADRMKLGINQSFPSNEPEWKTVSLAHRGNLSCGRSVWKRRVDVPPSSEQRWAVLRTNRKNEGHRNWWAAAFRRRLALSDDGFVKQKAS